MWDDGDVPVSRNGSDEAAHDVLAADEFAVPAPERLRHRGPVVLPDDPTGNPRPHDVLAAEEFAMPAAASKPWGETVTSRPGGTPRLLAEIAGVAAVLLVLRRRRR